jgi:hypothetical protein
MLNINLDKENGIAIFEPDAKLSESDFKSAVSIIDPYINESGKLNGLVIATKIFPGWESFAALLSHLSFVKDHHKKVSFVAFVTDSLVGDLAEHIANHFISAEVRSFKYIELQEAKKWIINRTVQL